MDDTIQVMEGNTTTFPEHGYVCILTPKGNRLRFTPENARLLAAEVVNCAEEAEGDAHTRHESGEVDK